MRNYFDPTCTGCAGGDYHHQKCAWMAFCRGKLDLRLARIYGVA